MLKMVKCDSNVSLKVDRVLVLVNGWEYFLEKTDKDDIAFGLVCGFEDELGSVYLPEIKPYIVSEAAPDVHDTLPAIGWEWKE